MTAISRCHGNYVQYVMFITSAATVSGSGILADLAALLQIIVRIIGNN